MRRFLTEFAWGVITGAAIGAALLLLWQWVQGGLQ